MLEKPDLEEDLIINRVHEAYNLELSQVSFLPLGADINTAVYRLITLENTAYFLKLRKGTFTEITVSVPKYLSEQGLRSIIAPLNTTTGQLWTDLGEYKVILYPFIQGNDGYEVTLSSDQWVEFGSALRRIHTVQLPSPLSSSIPRESYSSQYRELVRGFQEMVEYEKFVDPVASRFSNFLHTHRGQIRHIVERAEQLGQLLKHQTREFVLCHSDIHPGNWLISESGDFFIVDWDNPIYAPKEHDLIFAGVAPGRSGPAGREENLFYQGYGPTSVDRLALVYYRYERIVQDIAAYGEQLILSYEGREDREQSYQYFTESFLPGREVEIAEQTDKEI